MGKYFHIIVIVFVLLLFNACMTLSTQLSDSFDPECETTWLPNIYSGVIMDGAAITHFDCGSGSCEFGRYKETNNYEFFGLIDMPLSFALDTVLLPITVFKQIKYGNICFLSSPVGPKLSTNVPLMLEQTEILQIQIYEEDSLVKEYAVVKDDESHRKLIQWFKKHDRGWLKTPANYASGILVSGGGLSINFLDRIVILNGPDGKFTKSIAPADYAFLK